MALHWVGFANASQLPLSFSSCFVANPEAPQEGSGSQTLCVHYSDGLAAQSSHQAHASLHSVTSWCGCFGGAGWGSRLQLLLKDINIFCSRGAAAVQWGQEHLGSIPGSPADLLHCFPPFSSSKWRPFPAKFVFLGVRLPLENLSHGKEFGVIGLACKSRHSFDNKPHKSHCTGEHHEWLTGRPCSHHLPVSHLLPSDIILWLSFVSTKAQTGMKLWVLQLALLNK